ncbi:hypothetical protein XI07_04635 [Bradyrhizobium sp. CCBAU 11445]|nr:hypothetical protein [Bradyrhizobium sp. CCBAU 11445]
MADRDASAIDVVDGGIDPEVAGIKSLAGNRPIKLPQADVGNLQPMELQQLSEWRRSDLCSSRPEDTP